MQKATVWSFLWSIFSNVHSTKEAKHFSFATEQVVLLINFLNGSCKEGGEKEGLMLRGLMVSGPGMTVAWQRALTSKGL